MLRSVVPLAIAVLFPLIAPAQVLVPEGTDGGVLHIDAGSTTSRITGLDNVHGLSVAPKSGLIIAGSLSETPRSDLADVSIPTGVSDEDHDAHHGGTKDKTMESEYVSIVTILDLTSLALRARSEVPGMVHHVEVSADERFAAVTHPNLDGISIIELETGLVNTIDTGPVPEYAVADPSSGYFLVSNADNGTISEVGPTRGVVLRNIVPEGSPKHMQLTAERRLVVAEADQGIVSVINVATGSVEQRHDIGGELHDVQSDDQAIYVAARERDALVRIDLETGERTELALGPEPYHVTLVGDALYFSSAEKPLIWIIDTATLTQFDTIETNGVAHQMAPLPGG